LDNKIKTIIARVELIKEEHSKYVSQIDTSSEVFEHFNLVIGNLFKDFDKQIGISNRLIDQEQAIRDDISNSGTFSPEFDDPSDPYNDKAQLLDRLEQTLNDIEYNFQNILNVSYQCDKPFFGSIDYIKGNKSITSFIGKFPLTDTQLKPLVIDWRAPISALFYQNNGRNKNFEIKINNNLETFGIKSKKYIETAMGQIVDIYEPKSGNKEADKYLNSKLVHKKSGKLEDIITSIQSEQDEIIRSEIDKPQIIQGVAGSGKTTILFHRISYLLFTYPNHFHANRSCLIVPSKLFRTYTEDILLSLGLNSLNQFTFQELVNNFLHLPFQYIVSESDLSKEDLFNEVMDLVEKNESEIILSNITSNYNILIKLYNQTKNLKINIAEKASIIIDNLNNEKISKSTKEGIIKTLENNILPWNISSIIYPNNSFNSQLSKYLKRTEKIKIFDTKVEHGEIVDDRAQLEKNREYIHLSMDLLCKLAYIKYIVSGGEDYKYEILAVDEAQNLSINQVKVLSLFVKNKNLILAGDIYQQLSKHFSNWNELYSVFPNPSKFNLNISYRLSKEITNYINHSFPKDWINLTSPVSRKDSFKSIKGEEELFSSLFEEVKNNPQNNIAVILPALSQVEAFITLINSKYKDLVPYLTGQIFESGLSIIPLIKTKGLEFDCVFVAGFNDIDLNEKYVAMTRTVDRLYEVNGIHI
jgi:DNA helicase-2/ATP-dependent DNA helicase PcrA